MLLYLLQLNSYPLLLDLLRFSPAQLLGQRVSSIKPVLVGHSLLSPHACFQLTAHPTCTWWGGNHMLCVFCTEWFMQIDKTQPQLRPGLPDVWPQHGQSTTVLMDTTLLCTAHLTYSHESSLNKQVFIFENATRVFWVFSTIKRSFSSRNHKNFLGNSLCPYINFLAFFLTWERNENGWWQDICMFSPHCFCWLRNLRTTRSSRQHSLTNHAGIQLYGLHRTFPRQAITLTVYVASQNSWKNCKLLNFAKCIES